MSFLSIVVGLLLALGFRHFSFTHPDGELAGFVLGVTQLVLGLTIMVMSGRQVVVVTASHGR